MKKIYNNPELLMILMQSEDVITSSAPEFLEEGDGSENSLEFPNGGAV